MKINVVMGFFLPVPPVAGGAVEKSWHRLAVEFARRGHEVTVVSRRWPKWPDTQTLDGVRHLRIPGFAHTSKLWRNLLLDLVWCLRVSLDLPKADVTISNAVALPCWLGWLRPDAGRVAVMPGRMPKGQFYLYNHVSLVLATSGHVRDAVLAESQRWRDRIRVHGYPIDAAPLTCTRRPRDVVTIGYVGRIHREKGLDLLVDALLQLADRDLPPWRVLVCGPVDVPRGGSGPDYRDELVAVLKTRLPPDRIAFLPPVFDAGELARRYQEIDVFCYPSLATQGETFGVAVVEAMAAGAVPVVSRLACFRDFIRPGENAEVFDHDAADAPARLAENLASLVRDATRRGQLATEAMASSRPYDFPVYAGRMLEDFESLLACAPRETIV